MPTKLFQQGHKLSPGRKKGSVNKLNVDVLQTFYYVYENMDKNLSGNEAFLEWGRKNQKLFYVLFSKLIPKSLDIDISVNKHEDFVKNLAKDRLIKQAQAKQLDTDDCNTNADMVVIPAKALNIPPLTVDVQSHTSLKAAVEETRKTKECTTEAKELVKRTSNKPNTS